MIMREITPPYIVQQPPYEYPSDRHTPLIVVPPECAESACTGKGCNVAKAALRAVAISHAYGTERTRYMVHCDGPSASSDGTLACGKPSILDTDIGSMAGGGVGGWGGRGTREITRFDSILETTRQGDVTLVPMSRVMAGYLLSQESLPSVATAKDQTEG